MKWHLWVGRPNWPCYCCYYNILLILCRRQCQIAGRRSADEGDASSLSRSCRQMNWKAVSFSSLKPSIPNNNQLVLHAGLQPDKKKYRPAKNAFWNWPLIHFKNVCRPANKWKWSSFLGCRKHCMRLCQWKHDVYYLNVNGTLET